MKQGHIWIVEFLKRKKKPYSPYRDDISSCISSMSHFVREELYTFSVL